MCCEDHIIWKHMDADAHRIPIPRRRNPLAQRGETSLGNIIVSAVMHKIKVSRSLTYLHQVLTIRAPSSSCSNQKTVTCSK